MTSPYVRRVANYHEPHGRPGVAGRARTPGHRHASGQGRLPRSQRSKGLHQVRSGPLLPRRGRGGDARGGRPADDSQAFRQGHLRRGGVSEARTGKPARLGGRGRAALCVGPLRRGGGHSRRRRAGVGDQPGVCGSQSASGARRRPRSSRRAAGGLGPDARGRVAAGRRGRVGGPGGAGGLRVDRMAEDVRVAGLSRLCPDRALLVVSPGAPGRPDRCA
ncbi:Uncharacterised protein [Mycobacterium tuberculosis]|uniref:Uncharacterized protein n=1 Tax=Mycobacterium tuberculosis TaxID=1773 RepID=A0A654U5S7_MYCTX|nr:Uncharacterised protein [Mycobacterium tuberculosis]CKP69761.1 Uncharacterised protein [Mycobacterium tuberculosis]CNT94533.1 Uncharacterised protein [Mycobacterium tuberculosis]COX12604.1 Uncharacterised protein [Mycobacterium tuberculosis]